MINQNCLTKYLPRILLFLMLATLGANAKNNIIGNLAIDTSWAPMVYLSIISDFDQLNSMSNQMIIENSKIGKNGNFSFDTEYLPAGNNLYRIHLSKKGDPPASLIIGGKDENHMFLIANRESNISIKNSNSENIFGNIEILNSPQSQLMDEIDKMVLFLDTANFNSSSLKRELTEKALDEKLRQFADTCSFPLVALYAIYKTNFDINNKENPNYYQRFLKKWEKEKSPYFEEFRKTIPIEKSNRSYSFLFGMAGLVLGMLLTFFILKRKPKKKNQLQELTIQERKIYALLQQEKTNKEISDELNISLSTVKSHVNNIFSKLNIKSRKEIISVF